MQLPKGIFLSNNFPMFNFPSLPWSQRSAPNIACGASEGLTYNLWEVIAFGNLHIWGVVTWWVALGQIPNIFMDKSYWSWKLLNV